jgi:hypothetical protein
MSALPEALPLDSIIVLADQIADECLPCASHASEIIM